MSLSAARRMLLTWLVSLQATLGPVCPKVDRFPLTQARFQAFRDKEGKRQVPEVFQQKLFPMMGSL